VGQVGNLRPIGNRPSARPRKHLRRLHQTRSYRIHFDVPHNPSKLGVIPHQPVKTLVLPKRLPRKTQNAIPLPPRKSLQRAHNLRHRNPWRNQHMNVIRHHNPSVKLVLSSLTLPKSKRLHDHARHSRLFQIQRSAPPTVQQTVHYQKRLARSHRWWKHSVNRQTPIQPPSQKNRLSRPIAMRQSANMKADHKPSVSIPRKNSHQFSCGAGWQPAADCQSASCFSSQHI
jgi:hypothetical protein